MREFPLPLTCACSRRASAAAGFGHVWGRAARPVRAGLADSRLVREARAAVL